MRRMVDHVVLGRAVASAGPTDRAARR